MSSMSKQALTTGRREGPVSVVPLGIEECATLLRSTIRSGDSLPILVHDVASAFSLPQAPTTLLATPDAEVTTP